MIQRFSFEILNQEKLTHPLNLQVYPSFLYIPRIDFAILGPNLEFNLTCILASPFLQVGHGWHDYVPVDHSSTLLVTQNL